MTTSGAPHVECEQHHPGSSVSDVPGAADFYPAFSWGRSDVARSKPGLTVLR
jgi:hypothetical protein